MFQLTLGSYNHYLKMHTFRDEGPRTLEVTYTDFKDGKDVELLFIRIKLFKTFVAITNVNPLHKQFATIKFIGKT